MSETEEFEVRIYGKDVGLLTPEFVEICDSGDEAQLYHTINWLGGLKWRTKHDFMRGRIQTTPELSKSLTDAQYSQEYAVLKTVRFGTVIPEPEDGEHVPRTESYDKWFRWWNKYFEDMSDEEFREYDKAVSAKEDISRFRPEGDWK